MTVLLGAVLKRVRTVFRCSAVLQNGTYRRDGERTNKNILWMQQGYTNEIKLDKHFMIEHFRFLLNVISYGFTIDSFVSVLFFCHGK